MPFKFPIMRSLEVYQAAFAIPLTLCHPMAHVQDGEWAWHGGPFGTNTGIPNIRTLGCSADQEHSLPARGLGHMDRFQEQSPALWRVWIGLDPHLCRHDSGHGREASGYQTTQSCDQDRSVNPL